MNKGDDMSLVGKILNTHGIKGEVKVKQITHFIERFQVGETVYVENSSENIKPLKIDSFRTQKNNLLLHFEGYNSIEAAEALKGMELKIKEDQLTPLDANEYYYHEIIGCEVFTTGSERIGIVESILSPGANDVFIVRSENDREILIPYIEPVVKEVDVKAKKIIIELMEGLLE